MPTVWFYQNIATNKQNTYSRKLFLHHINAINIRPKHKREASNFRFGSCLPPNVSFFRVYIPFLSHKTYKLVEAFFLSCRL